MLLLQLLPTLNQQKGIKFPLKYPPAINRRVFYNLSLSFAELIVNDDFNSRSFRRVKAAFLASGFGISTFFVNKGLCCPCPKTRR